MHTKTRFIPVLGFIILAGLSSCTNFFSTIHTNTASNDIQRTQVSKTKENLVPVTFTFKDPYASRSITSDSLVPDSYTFNFVSNTDAANSFTQSLPVSTEYNIELEIGDNYTLTIQGFNSTTLVCETASSSTFTVQPGGALDPSPSIQMQPSGEGSFSVIYSWTDSSAAVSSVTASLIDSDANPVADSITLTVDLTAKTAAVTTSSPLPVGNYILTVNFFEGADVILSYKESVTIKAGQTSTSDKVTSGTTVNLGQSWFAVPPPEVQDAYYIVAPDGSFTVVWRDESESAGLSYEVSYTTATSFDTIYVTTPLADNYHAVKISGLAEPVVTVSVTARNAAGDSPITAINRYLKFSPEVTRSGVPLSTAYYFEMGPEITLTPNISWSLIDYPDVTNGSTAVEFSGTTYAIPQTAGTSTITTNLGNPSVDLNLYTIKMLPQGKCYVDSGGNDSNSGTSNIAGDALATVSEAVSRLTGAHVTSASYTINVSGTHDLSSAIIINASAVPPLRIDGGTTATILQRSGTAAGIFTLLDLSDDSTNSITIQNLTVSGGRNNYGGGISKYGNFPLNLSTVVINECEAVTTNAGGLYIDNGIITLTGCTIQNCSALMGGGGGIYINGGTITLNTCAIQENSALDGGGMYINGGTVEISNSRIGDDIGSDLSEIGLYFSTNAFPESPTASNKASSSGGGIYNNGELTITASSITYNHADSGGGVYNTVNGDVEFTSGFVAGNKAGTSGGGVYNAGPMIQNGGSISYNNSQTGAGVYNNFSYTMTNGEISYNYGNTGVLSGTGGGVYVASNSFTMDGGSINNNTNRAGGGVYVEAGSFFYTKGNIENNTAESSNHAAGNAEGGGIYIASGSFNASGADLKQIQGNKAESSVTDTNGGGLFAAGGTINLLNCTFTDNTANATGGNVGSGGGVYLTGGETTLQGTTLIGNNTTDRATSSTYGNKAHMGGGIYVNGAAVKLTLSDTSKVCQNFADSYGGGMYIQEADSVSIGLSSIISYNAAEYGNPVTAGAGGGVYVTKVNSFTSNGTIEYNYTYAGGGGIAINESSSGTYNINGTISNNRISSTSGSALWIGNDAVGTTVNLNAVMNNNTSNGISSNPVVYADTGNSDLIFNPGNPIAINNGVIYLCAPAKITVSTEIPNPIILDTDNYPVYLYNNVPTPTFIVLGDITNLSIFDTVNYTLRVDGYLEEN